MITRCGFVLLMLCVGVRFGRAAGLTAEEQRIVQAVDAQVPEFAGDLERVIQIDSATENLAGVRAVGAEFARHLSGLGFETRFASLPASTGRAGHLIAEHKGSRGKRVLLIGHLDTVYPGANFHREGDRVSGAGVGDMKGGDLVMIYALRALNSVGALADTQIRVVMSGDEEAPGEPLSVSRQDLRKAATHSDVSLAFESAIGLTGTVARRGIVMWELEIQGPTGHSSGIFSAPMGSGAVYESARILEAFRAAATAMDGVTLNPALIAGGASAELSRTGGTMSGKSNVIAQRVVLRGDMRFLDAKQFAEMKAKMFAIVQNHLPRTSSVLTFDDGYPAMSPTPENYALLSQLDLASRDLGFGAITAFDPRGRGAGDISFVSPPLPGLDGLGLDGDGQHTPHETSDLSTAPALIKRAAVLIYRLTR